MLQDQGLRIFPVCFSLYFFFLGVWLSLTPSSTSSNKIMIFLNSTSLLLRSMDGLSSPELSPTGDRMSELSALVHKGEKRGFFLDKMPAPIQRQIEDENLQFLRNRAVYNQEYITFVRKLASCSLVSGLWSLEIDCWKMILTTRPVLTVLQVYKTLGIVWFDQYRSVTTLCKTVLYILKI